MEYNMSRKIKRSINRLQKFQKTDSLHLGSLSFAQAIEIYLTDNKELTKPILESFVIVGIAIYILVQLSASSKPETAEWIEKLSSYKDIKQRIINGEHGMNVAACFGMALAFPYLMEDLQNTDTPVNENCCHLVRELVESHSSNVKRIKPSAKSAIPYARGEAGAFRGQMLSCPSTNIQILNIDGTQVLNYNLSDAIKKIGIDEKILKEYDINQEDIKEKIRNIFLVDNGGLPITILTYNEPDFVKSEIQNEVLGESLVRNNTVNTKLEKGSEPSSSITKNFITKHLSKNELFAYNIAIRTGDIQMAKKLTNLAVARSKDS